MKDMTNISVSKETHGMLNDIGRKGQSFDVVVRDLLAYALLTEDQYRLFVRERLREGR